MRIPTIEGIIDRRILVNYRVDPERLAAILPAPFRPQLVAGHGMAGICLIRLKQVRPRGLPALLGLSSENAAHRVAVEWESTEDTNRQSQTGVYIPRRDTNSRLNTWLGGRVFPGEHHLARFDVAETDSHFSVAMRSVDGSARVAIDGHLAAQMPEHSIFRSVAEASAFFECGSVGYSPNTRCNTFEGLELRTFNWQVEPLAVEHVASSFFDDESLFPPGTAVFDHALLMHEIVHQWHGQEAIEMTGALAT